MLESVFRRSIPVSFFRPGSMTLWQRLAKRERTYPKISSDGDKVKRKCTVESRSTLCDYTETSCETRGGMSQHSDCMKTVGWNVNALSSRNCNLSRGSRVCTFEALIKRECSFQSAEVRCGVYSNQRSVLMKRRSMPPWSESWRKG